MNRRGFVQGMCYGGLATLGAPLVSLARVPGNGRFVFVLLRGGLDGLATVVPIDDPAYGSIRGRLAYDPDELLPIGEGFALAPGLAPLSELAAGGDLVALQAMAIPYRTRSHFDGQAILETGLDRPDGSSNGWLNRLLQVMEGTREGIAVAAGMPRSMSGSIGVATWSPASLGATSDAYIERLHVLYQRDPILLDRFEAALQLQEVATEATAGMAGAGQGRRRGQMAPVMRATARFLREPDGPNVAAVEFGGWDTHTNQGLAGGSLDRLLAGLAEGILAYEAESGSSWSDTTIVVMTEFGRTARPNGTGGTDHGTAGAGLVVGPGVARGPVLTDWPGLSGRELYEGRDLRPTLDTRAVLKGVVMGVFDLTATQANRVFPGSTDVRPRTDLIR